jgi:nitroreductase
MYASEEDSMDAFDTILTRRSIRKYQKKSIAKEVLQDLLRAACSAPSAGNQQPWQFIVLDERNILNVIHTFHPSAKILMGADKALLVCGDLDLEKLKGYWMVDCAAAAENILLAAHAKELGACWLGIYPREGRMAGMRKLLHLPAHIIPFALISLGYPAEKKPPADRFNPSRVHYNKW